jgi:choline dehydrogenase-like flavoprotein
LRGEFDRLGVNGINWRQDLSSGAGVALGALRDTNHLMGGAMMGMDPLRSVVDTNLRVHGLSNLFVASLSTYPAGGSSNPTFTLVALTLRLAERLKAVAAQPAASIRTRSAVLTAP